MSQIDRTDGLVGNTAIKAPARVIATTNITLSGYQTIDGVALAAGDENLRVVVAGQTDPTENGIYDADSGDWNRAQDFDGNNDVVLGSLVKVNAGTTYGNTYWRQASADPIVIGTSAITFAQALASDSSLVSFLQAGTGAVVRTAQAKMREIKSITDYGASTANTAAVNTPLIQAAIDANYGNVLVVPPGTFLAQTAGSTVAPVGNCLTITDEITILFEGIIKGANNSNAIRINAGSTDFVYLIGQGGGLQGYGSFFEATNRNGALVLVSAGIARIRGMKLIDPPQYSVFADGVAGGEVVNCDLIGGDITYPGDNNYHICLNDTAPDWKVEGCRTMTNAAGGKSSQAVASIALTAGDADRTMVINNQFLAQWEKATYIFGDDVKVANNIVSANAQGEGIRTIGLRPTITGNTIRSCVGGGITAYDGGGALIDANSISNCNGVGIQVAYQTTSNSGKTLSNAQVTNNRISGTTTTPTTSVANGAGIAINGDTAASPNLEARILVAGNQIDTANYSTADERAGIYINPGSSAQTFRDLRVENNTVNDCGGYGVRFTAGSYVYARVNGNKVRDPGMLSVTLGANRSAFRWDANVAMTGQSISGNEARSESTASGMDYGFSNAASSGIQSCLISDNHVRGQVTAGYQNMQDTSNTRSRNRQGDNALQGSFSCTVGTTAIGITNSNIQAAGNFISIEPLNVEAMVAQGSTNGLYFDGTVTSTASFTLKSGGAIASTATYRYRIEV